jgi:hypothetical protein
MPGSPANFVRNPYFSVFFDYTALFQQADLTYGGGGHRTD